MLLEILFVRGLVNVDVLVGQQVLLSCETSVDTESVDWLRNDEHLSRDGGGSHGYEMQDSGRVHRLMIQTASRSDEAKYTCSCRDDVTSCTVLVEEGTMAVLCFPAALLPLETEKVFNDTRKINHSRKGVCQA